MPRQLNLHKKQKVRGLKRRIIDLLAMPQSAFPERSSQLYVDYKLPIHNGLIRGVNARTSIKRLCMRSLLETCIALRREKPKDEFTRVVALISMPDLFSSRVTVFFDEEYFSHFFERSGPYQIWSALPLERSLLQEWQMADEFQLDAIGYREEIVDEDLSYDGEVWFFGDVRRN